MNSIQTTADAGAITSGTDINFTGTSVGSAGISSQAASVTSTDAIDSEQARADAHEAALQNAVVTNTFTSTLPVTGYSEFENYNGLSSVYYIQ